ncbi:hypothetical protein [Rhizobium sp. MHM7A]|uniref:hypothetical protein n=1 Tax=Rhizobium sp. MHM7A TaxID=2583233 RepID=UPI0011074A27|nr:hypothetical protein [Rhizobium sp. MHM7A]TLX16373.1 hypothetical protein FFR93_03305 [Rhizobium sp. MHM7A]
MKNDFINDDAAEMHSILRSASCIKRYDSISHQLLSELLVAIATEGEVVGGNNRGSDVLSPKYGKIEVKSRILGTDGPFPRVSLKPHNIEKADWFVGIRWTRDFQFHEAWMLPKSAASTLHAARKQGSGLAHITWESWKAGPGAVDLTSSIRAALSI